jgi:diguanylate cyclase (GGDEF)-like protein/PAS domain S-box-containing protein
MTRKASGTRWLALGLGVDAVLALIDASLGADATLAGLLVTGPLLASISARVRGTALVSAVALALALVLGLVDGVSASADYIVRCSGVTAVGALAVWLAQLALERERATTRLAIQRAIAQALAASTTLAEAAPAILSAIGESLHWQTAAIWRVEREDRLRRVAGWTAATAELEEFERISSEMTFARGVGLPGRVWQHGKPVWISDVLADDNFPRARAAAQGGLHGAVGFPILSVTGTLGVIELFAPEVREPDEEMMELMMSFGGQLGERIERSRAEAEAATREARNRAIVESALDAVITMDHHGRVIEFNPAAEETFGRTREEALGQEMAELIIPPSLRAAHREGLRRYLQTGEGPALGIRLELTGMRSDGSEFPAELAISRIGTLEPPTFTGYVRDISERKQAEERLTKSQRLLADAEEVARTGGWEWDVRSGRVDCSAGLYRILGLPPDGPAVTVAAIIGTVHPDDRDLFEQAIERTLRVRKPFEFECRVVRADSRVRVVRTSGKVVLGEAGESVKLIGTAQDVTAEMEARSERELLASVVDSSDDAILTKSSAGVITSWNGGAERLYGYPAEVAVGQRVDLTVPPQRRDEEGEILRKVFAGESLDHFETQRVLSDGSTVAVSLTVSPVRDASGRIVSASVIARDITERRRYEERLQHLADHDPLTDLLNRRRFEEVLSHELARAERYDSRGAVLSLDIDKFKAINDSGGHAAGDALISEVATVLKDRLRASDVVARLGGDEFGVLLPEAGRDEAQAAAEQILNALRNCAVVVDGQPFRVTVSIGVAVFESQEATAEEVLVDADLAMYGAKTAGRDRVVVYTLEEGRQVRATAKLTWAQRIRDALDHDRFVLYWQPILDLATREVSHGELLLRMLGDDGELIAPGAFLPTAERMGLIHAIDRWVTRRAVHLIADEARGGPLPLAVNLSGKSVVGDPELPHLIENEIGNAAIDPSNLIFEITETAAIANMSEARGFADTISKLGCALALDDFGTGFGSFYYLKYLPVDYVKMDGEFVQNLPRSDTDEHMVRAIVEVAQGMGIKTVAESVADNETIGILRHHGVDYAQGFYVGHPCPLSQMQRAVDGAAVAATRVAS